MSSVDLSTLSKEEREAVAQILNEISEKGTSEMMDDILYEDWKEIPVDIRTFLHDPYYLGKGLSNAEGKYTLFPYWEDLLIKLYPDPLKPATCNTLALTGGIGLGKSTEAVIIGLYELYRMLCLKDPSVYYGIMATDVISFAVINITLEAASGVAWSKMQNLIQASDWFLQHGSLSKTEIPTWRPFANSNIELICGSQPRHFIGRCLYWIFLDEISFIPNKDVEAQKQKAMELVSSATARMQSRFMRGGVNPTIMVLASSKRTEQSFLETYIENKKKNESKTTIIIDEPQWIIRPDKQSDRTFKVAIGNKFLPSEVLPPDILDEECQGYIERGFKLIDVPIGYYENFIDDLDIALTDIAGISTSSMSNYISGERITQAKTESFENPFTKDIIEVGNGQDDISQYSDYFDLSKIDPTMKTRPLFIHLDMSLTGDKTGVGGVWIKGKRPPQEGVPESKELLFQLAFVVSVKAPRGHQVSFEKTRNFIYWLKEKGFNIKGISSDTYARSGVEQDLLAKGYNYSIISVDRVNQERVCEPYAYLKNSIYERRLLLPRRGINLLTEELIGLQRNNNNGHVDHTPQGINCFTGDTKIKMLDGSDKTILELLDDYNNGITNYVYSFNHITERIEPKKIQNVFKSGTNATLVEVTLDNGEVIHCTPEHKFMTRLGDYKEASELSPGDSLMPLYTKYPEKGLSNYRMYYEPMEDKWHFEHRQFAEEIYDKRYLVHHKDCNSKNNRPDNLIWMSKSAHNLEHARLQTGAQSETARKKRAESVKLSHKNVENTKNGLLRYYKGSLEERKIKKEKHDQYLQEKKDLHNELSRLFNIDFDVADSEVKRRCLAIYANYKAGHNVSFDLSKLSLAELKAAEKQTQIDACNYFKADINALSRYEIHGLVIKYYNETIPGYKEHIASEVSKNHAKGKYKKAEEAISNRIWWTNGNPGKENNLYIKRDENPPEGFWRGRTLKNHKVVSVKILEYTEDVYDITVEDNPNFALSAGVFVHNSKDSADAICGALWNASQHGEEFAFDYGETLETIIGSNEVDDFKSNFKEQFTESLKETPEFIRNIYSDMDIGGSPLDIMDGILNW